MFGVVSVRLQARWVTGAVVWSLLVTLTTALPPAAAETPAPVDADAAPTFAQAKAIAKTFHHRVEALDRKTARVEVSANPNGTVRVEAHARSVAVRDSSADDGWRDIDTNLGRSGALLRPRVTNADISFSGDGTGPAVTMRHGSASWSLSWPTALPAPSVSGATAVYSDAAPGVDLQLWAGAEGFSQRIIIRERPSMPPVFDMPLQTDGVRVRAAVDDSLTVSDMGGSVLASSSPSVMWDARSTDPDGDDPSHYAPVDTSVHATAAGEVLRLTPNAQFLADPETQYPVVVDPSPYLTNKDTFVHSGAAYENTQYDGQELLRLGGGSEGNIRRTLMQIPFNGEHLGKHVVDAKLELYEVSSGSDCANPKPFHVNKVQETFNANAVTWLTRPAASTKTWGTVTSSAGYGAGCPNAWVRADVTTLMQALADGSPNYGFQLKADNETATNQYKAFASLDSLTYPTADPRIVMELNSYPNAITGRGTKRYYNTARPCLTGVFSDPDGGSGRVEYEIWTRNSDGTAGTKAADFWGPTVASGQPSPDCVPLGETALADGEYMWRAVGHDALTARQSSAGTTDWSSWINLTVDTTAPQPPLVTSSTHPRPGEFYDSRDISAAFTSADANGVLGYAVVLDTATDTVPPTSVTNTAGALSQTVASDGEYVLHVRARDIPGNWGETVHFPMAVGEAGLAEFAEPVSAAEAAAVAESTGNEAVELRASFPEHDGGAIVVAYDVPPDVTGAALNADYQEEVVGLLNEVKAELASDSSVSVASFDSTGGSSSTEASSVDDAIAAATSSVPLADAVLVTPSETDGLANIAADAAVSSVADETQPPPTTEDTMVFASSSSPCPSFKPSSGMISTQPTGDNRYVFMSFQWNQARHDGMTCWRDIHNDFNVTWEQQAVYNNFDGRHYLGAWSRGWSTNMVNNTYREQDVRDPGRAEYRTYTVGDATWSAKVGKLYWTHRKLTKGNALTDRGKVSGQVGYRKPKFCYTKWCVFGHSTENMIPWDGHHAPGRDYW